MFSSSYVLPYNSRFNNQNLPPSGGITKEPSNQESVVRQGWLNQEQVEVSSLNPDCHDVGSSSSFSLVRSPLISLETPVSVSLDKNIDALEKTKTQFSPKSSLVSFLSRTDAVTALSQYQNGDYFRKELQSENLPFLKKSVEELREVIQKIPSNLKERQNLDKLSSNLLYKIDAIIGGKKSYAKVATKLLFSLMSIGLCILPLLVAQKNNYRQVLATNISGYTKTLLILIGLVIGETSDVKSFCRHLKERHIPYFIPTVPFIMSTYNKSIDDFSKNNSLIFSFISAVFCSLIYISTSYPKILTKPAAGLFYKTKEILKKGADSSSSEVPEDVLSDFKVFLDSIKSQSESFLSRRESFEVAGSSISDVLSNQVIEIKSASKLLEKEISRILKEESNNIESGNSNKENKEFAAKFVFSMMATLLCAGSAATFYDEPLGLVAESVDAALVTGEMFKTTFKASADTQRAAEKFASYAGLSPFLLVFGLINKVPKQHFADSLAGMIVGTTLLTAATITLPRTTSELLTKLILNLLNHIKKPTDSEKTSVEV